MILYRIILVLLAPVLAVVFALRWLRGQETRKGLAERLSLGPRPAHSAKTVWVHGASLGELTAARPLLDAILSLDPGIELIVTMNSYTARDMVAGWGNARLHTRMAPLDYALVVRKFLKTWSPRGLVILENELWPNRLTACGARNIPVLIASGRLSERAFSMWSRFGSITRPVLDAVSYLAPLDQTAATRFHDLGLDPSRTGTPLLLKSAVALSAPDPAELSQLIAAFDRSRTILAASTHEGEDALILRAFLAARLVHPELRLILAPRHPDRAPTVSQLLEEMKVPFQLRSTGSAVPPDGVVLLADTTGEMAMWYTLAGITMIGATWVEKGGHTPFEPAQFASAIIHGPSVYNHAQAFAALDQHGGALIALDEDKLVQEVLTLCNDKARSQTTEAADNALAPLRANSAPLAQLVDRLAQLSGI